MLTKIPHYCVVGGGLSGLATAYFITLAKPIGSYRLTLLESGSRFGGWVQSERNTRTGALLELGPHSARATGGNSQLLLRMVLNLGLRNSLLWMRSGEDGSRRLIYTHGRHYPVSFGSFLSYSSPIRLPFGSIMRNLFGQSPTFKADISVDEFFRTRLGDRYADYIGNPMMRGIYSGDSRQLSAEACLSQLVEVEKRGSSLIAGLLKDALISNRKSPATIPRVFDESLAQAGAEIPPANSIAWSLSDGMQLLTDTLVNQLRSTDPHTIQLVANSSVESISVTHTGHHLRVDWVHESGNHEVVNDNFDAVFLCCPSFKAANILQPILTPTTLHRLKKDKLPWADVAVVHLEVDKTNQPPLPGFGHLVPQLEDANILGVIYDSFAFPALDSPQGNTLRYTIMIRPYEKWITDEDGSAVNELTHTAINVLRTQLKIKEPLVLNSKACIYRDCIPQYPVGHVDNLSSIRDEVTETMNNRWPKCGGIQLVGFSYDGVGLADVVSSALKAVTRELSLT